MKAYQNLSSSPRPHRPMRKHVNSAAERNKDPILEVLKDHVKPPPSSESQPSARCLEISSGSGQHVVHFAPHFPWIVFHPSEIDTSSIESIAGYVHDSSLPNIKPPIYLDVCESFTSWGGGTFSKASVDYIVNINMLHISPFRCAEGLFQNGGQILKPDGILFTYGPYAFDGKLVPESNVRFDAMLKSQDPEWGVRDVSRLAELATQNGIRLIQTIDMPANNKVLVWKKN